MLPEVIVTSWKKSTRQPVGQHVGEYLTKVPQNAASFDRSRPKIGLLYWFVRLLKEIEGPDLTFREQGLRRELHPA
jgi:hypothetical protein